MVVRHDGRVVEVNAALAAVMGRADHQLRGEHLRDLVHSEDAPLVDQRWKYLAVDGENRVECRLRRADGRVVWAELTMSIFAAPLASTPPVPAPTLEAPLGQAAAASHVPVQVSPPQVPASRTGDVPVLVDSVPITAPTGVRSSSNQVALNQAAVNQAAVNQAVPNRVVPNRAVPVGAAALGTGSWSAVVTVKEVTEVRRLRDQLKYRAEHDSLTGLSNRGHFLSRLDAMFRESEDGTMVGLCCVDIDNFKSVNDSYGHGVGDVILVEIGRRLTAALPSPEFGVARTGGDEFAVLVRTAVAADVGALARRLSEVVLPPVVVDGHRLSVTCSVGAVVMATSESTPAELVSAADITLAWAKSGGKNRWELFDPRRSTQELARSTLSASMSHALECGEFGLLFQPIGDLDSCRLRGAEALVRWNHPQLGVISPKEFIDLAEGSGFIVALGRWVLEQACRQARGWRGAIENAFVSVNLSVGQLREPGIVDEVREVLARTGLDPSRLQLELTESTFVGAAGDAERSLRALSDLGVAVAIDDFGTGYSNLAYLRTMPVRALKLAGPFVTALDRSPALSSDWILVDGIVTLAHRLGLTVTAEGVETEKQATALRGIHADYVQGHWFAEPMASDELVARFGGRAAVSTRN